MVASDSNAEKSLDVTLLLESAASGDEVSANELFSIVYGELKRMASAQMSTEPNHTLQSTALVHEVWIKLIGKQEGIEWNNRGHFFAAAAQAMRRILVDAARSRRRIKRGGDLKKVELHDHDLTVEPDEQLLALDEALELLRQEDERKATLVNLRYFGGFTNAQAAEQLGISTATAERDWTFAKAWLRAKMDG